MNLVKILWISASIYAAYALEDCNCPDYNGAKIVTYGEPCVTTRQYPIQIEGPKPPPAEEKIPVSLQFKVISDMYVQPSRTEYPIAIELPNPTSSSSEKLIIEDTLRGKVYGYNTYIPPAANPSPPSTNYNYVIDVPITTKDVTYGYETKQVQRLKGLKTRVDRVLVPACEVSSSSSSSTSCQC